MITGGKSAIALSVMKAFANWNILLADYGEIPDINMPHFEFVSLGSKNTEVTAHNLLSKCLDSKADTLLPLYDFEQEAVAVSKQLFEEFGIRVLAPSPGDLEHLQNTEPAVKNWTLLDNGKPVFSTAAGKSIANVSGAYFTDKQGNLLKLLTV